MAESTTTNVNWAEISDDEEPQPQENQIKEVVIQEQPQEQNNEQKKQQKKPYQKHHKPEWVKLKELQKKQAEQIQKEQQAALEARRIKPSKNNFQGLMNDSDEDEQKPEEQVQNEQQTQPQEQSNTEEQVDQYQILKQKQTQEEKQQQQKKKDQKKKDSEDLDAILNELGFTQKQTEQTGDQDKKKKKKNKNKDADKQPTQVNTEKQPVQQVTTEKQPEQQQQTEKVDIKKVLAEKAKKAQTGSHQVDKDLERVKLEIEKRNQKTKKNKKQDLDL